ncbi:MAG TPA: flagellar basal-body rod protein FlgF, partial [Candidatus Latescibacteria bacterium]|nr:flagellar basal-body rod protein FlgF [Candidatus Latescibacterota bacterium]
QILINQRGEVIVDGEHVDRLLIMDFQHPYRLVKVGSGLFAPEDEMDAGEPAKEAKVRQGYLEGSNVRAIEEMVEMLLSYRRYEADHKAIQIQDETLGKAVNELGTVR